MNKSKIYDCFTFFNELDILELRLEILYPYVDKFVLVEMDKTFSGKDKPFYFEENKKRYRKYLDKIIHIKVDNPPKLNSFFNSKIFRFLSRIKIFSVIINRLDLGKWKIQNFQRNQIIRGLDKCKDEDIIFVSDVDEIPNPKKFKLMKKYFNRESKRIGFEQELYFFYLNGLCNKKHRGGTKCCSYRFLKNVLKNQPQKIRIRKNIFLSHNYSDVKMIKDGGWHFTYLGGTGKISEKIKDIVGGDQLKIENEPSKIEKFIEKGEFFIPGYKITYLKSLDRLPKEIRKNQKKWAHLIKKDL